MADERSSTTSPRGSAKLVRRARARLSAHGRAAYYVLRHPLHVALALALVALSIGAGSAWFVIALLVIEALALGALPRWRRIAERAHAYARESEHARAKRQREGLRSRMHPEHVSELAELEKRVERVHAAARSPGLGKVLGELFDLDRSLDAYVRLSIAYRAATEAAACADATALSFEIRRLLAERDRAESPRIDRALASRIGSLARTLSCVRKMEQERLALGCELATIAAHCRLAEARATALVGTEDLHRETERLTSELELRDEALQELVAMRAFPVRVADESAAALEVAEIRAQRRVTASPQRTPRRIA